MTHLSSMSDKFGMLLLVTWLWIPSQLAAQPERYELGRRLIEFEKAWDRCTDPDRRALACVHLNQAVQAFFSARLGQAGKEVDTALTKLVNGIITSDQQWAQSLLVQVDCRLLESSKAAEHAEWRTSSATVRLQSFYPTNAPKPKQPQWKLATQLVSAGAMPTRWVTLPIASLPVMHQQAFAIQVDSSDLDGYLHFQILDGETVLRTGSIALSTANQRSSRLDGLQQLTSDLQSLPRTADALTLQERIRLLKMLADLSSPETDYPASRLLAEAEALAKAVSQKHSYFGQGKVGQFWLTLPTGLGQTHVRLQAPKEVVARKPLPLVIALHGAGGSENMFFDTYGHGQAVTYAQERGWLFVAPRVGFAMKVQELIDAVDVLYPVDRHRVYLIGHSMGAAVALSTASQTPSSFAGLAALGGGRAIKVSEGMRSLPFFIGIGNKDFAYRGAKSLAEALRKADVTTVEYREYPEIEHLVIVQVALPDVYAFFDRINLARQKERPNR